MTLLRYLSFSSLFMFLFLSYGCKKKDVNLFTLLDPKKTHVTFNNKITESDSLNIMTYEYIYNGGGVALADFNNDGLDEIFFTGNMVTNKLYLNKGNLVFEDISKQSGIDTFHNWSSGVSVIDINQDGKKDIYIATNTYKNKEQRKNLLFINTSDERNIKFTEMAEDYGIADTSYCMNAVFFDFDNDLDLDLFMINNRMDKNDLNRYSRKINDKSSGKVDKLFRNDFNKEKGHAYFTDVSESAGITIEGYSLGVNICDLNKDGWKDIYITNDFLTNDILYVNNQNGTFTNRINDYVNHTCFSAMGNDIVDINNDGLQDIIAVDMLPEDNYRKKTMVSANNYSAYTNNKDFKYTFQFQRNVLQINQGFTPTRNNPVFSEVAMMADIDATDWSWAPLVADFDNDGFRDIIITNGFPKDITDKDFMDYQSENMAYVGKKDLLKKIPSVKLKNYAFKNYGNLKFENKTSQWGIEKESFSSGAAYGDLDNDGDLDYVVNNIDDEAHIYKNNLNKSRHSNYLQIILKGNLPNLDAIGTVINYKTATLISTYEHNPSRGYLSSMSPKILFGIAEDSLIDLEIIWPDNTVSNLKNVKSNQVLIVDKSQVKCMPFVHGLNKKQPLLINNDLCPKDSIKEIDYIDFSFDPLLLKKQSNLGPGVAIGDVNNDNLDDIYITGPKNKNGMLFIQKAGKFIKQKYLPINNEKEELAPLFFDADNDGDLDLYIGCGSTEFNLGDIKLKDEFLINVNGNFINKSYLIKIPPINTSCVKGSDFDGDGDIDLFIGGKSKTYKYPMADKSYLLINKTVGNNISFSIDSITFNKSPRMVTDALWTDFDSDNDLDLIVVGEWSSIKLYENKNGVLLEKKSELLNGLNGFWNSISGGDIDNDGDIDYIVGNHGLNSNIKGSKDYPVRIYAKDFDSNGSYDFVNTFYLFQNKKLQEVPYHVKGDLIKELNGLRKKFVYHAQLANAPIDSIITKEMRKNALVLSANYFNSCVLINKGNGNFDVKSLPNEAQYAPVFGILLQDVNNDNNLDLILSGNDYGVELAMGKMDASYGCTLLGKGNGEFSATEMSESGLFLKSEARGIASIKVNGKMNLLFVNHNAPMQMYEIQNHQKTFSIGEHVKRIQYINKDNKIVKTEEIYLGSGYLAQSSANKSIPLSCTSMLIINYSNTSHKVDIK
jgi:enediyne biosynthesis protein E4